MTKCIAFALPIQNVRGGKSASVGHACSKTNPWHLHAQDHLPILNFGTYVYGATKPET